MDTNEPLVLEDKDGEQGPPPNKSYPVSKALLQLDEIPAMTLGRSRKDDQIVYENADGPSASNAIGVEVSVLEVGRSVHFLVKNSVPIQLLLDERLIELSAG